MPLYCFHHHGAVGGAIVVVVIKVNQSQLFAYADDQAYAVYSYPFNSGLVMVGCVKPLPGCLDNLVFHFYCLDKVSYCLDKLIILRILQNIYPRRGCVVLPGS